MLEEIVGFNKRLTAKMAERGVSQADLCRMTGLASSMVSHYCTGQRMPSMGAALKIAAALNTTVRYLAYGNPPQKEKSKKGYAVGEKSRKYLTGMPEISSITDEQELIDKLCLFNDEGQAKVLTYIEDLLSTGKYN